MSSANQKKDLLKQAEQEIERTQEALNRLSCIKVRENDQKRICELKARFLKLLKEYEAFKN
ncbi:MAG: hypothetical protein H8D67_18340 [Deltaproteobacteria bacterium]|nr:hypothetical protein [Deltaproteobacteria bacterium]